MLRNNLSRIMGEKKINMMELHRLTGIAHKNIFNLYHGKTKMIKLETIDKICDALEVSVGELFEHVPD